MATYSKKIKTYSKPITDKDILALSISQRKKRYNTAKEYLRGLDAEPRKYIEYALKIAAGLTKTI